MTKQLLSLMTVFAAACGAVVEPAQGSGAPPDAGSAGGHDAIADAGDSDSGSVDAGPVLTGCMADPALCGEQTPVCGADSVCHACEVDSDCTAGVCMPDGSCAAASTVAYASPAGGEKATCTLTDKCALDTAAAVTGAAVIHLDPGTYSLTASVGLAGSVTLVGRAATVKSIASGAALSVNTNANVTIDYLEIDGGSGQFGNGIYCSEGSLVLNQVTVQHSGAQGIYSFLCALTVQQSTIRNNAGFGIEINGGLTTVSRSTIASNQLGGITMSAAGHFDITNTFVTGNGSEQSIADTGGVRLFPDSSPNSRFEFNTVVGNAVGDGTTGGINCIAAFTADNNIIVGNIKLAETSDSGGSCAHLSSLVGETTSAVGFKSDIDFHLTPASPAIDQAITASTVAIDFDGDARPQGAAKDIGADEYKP